MEIAAKYPGVLPADMSFTNGMELVAYFFKEAKSAGLNTVRMFAHGDNDFNDGINLQPEPGAWSQQVIVRMICVHMVTMM